MSIVIKRYSTDISSYIDRKSVTLKRALTNEVSSLKFRVRSTAAVIAVSLGAVIDLYEDQGVVDYYSESNRNTDFSPIHSATTNFIGQTFTANIAGNLTSCKFYLKKNGTPTGTIRAKLYAMSGTYGTSGQPTGSALATSNDVIISAVSTSLGLTTFTFTTTYILDSQQKYCILLDATSLTGDASNYIAWGEDTTSPTHGGNRFSSSNGGTSYNTTSSVDMCFYIIADGGGGLAVHTFGGTVTEKRDAVEGGIVIGTDYLANDWSFRLNSKLVAQTYEADDPQNIVNDIIWNFTDRTFGTTSVVLGGFDVASVKFNYEQVSTSLEKLAKQIGWEWYVDPDKQLHFFPPDTTVTAPFNIDDTSGNLEWGTLEIQESLMNMKNSIYVIGGTYTKVLDASSTPDIYLTDGTKSVFSLAYPYTAATIVVTLAGVTQTIGTDQISDPGSVQVLYNEGGRFIRFTSVPAAAQTVKIYGDAQIPILAHVQDLAAITAYGEIQDVIIDQQIKSIEEAQARGNAAIGQYGSPVTSVKFSTIKSGLVVGQTIRVNSPLFNRNVLVVIKKITGKMYTPTAMRYDVECVGTDRVSFVDIMKLLLTQIGANTVVNDSTVLQVLLLLSESIAQSDTLNAPTSTTGPYKWGVDASAKGWNFFTWA